MIQANELRIGNWYNHNGEYCQVSPNTILEVWESPRKWVQPIPLTPEILEKCNIERIGNLANSATRKFYKIGKITIELISKNRIAVYIDSPTELILISFQDYLHQLQNLYFALTGGELTFKP